MITLCRYSGASKWPALRVATASGLKPKESKDASCKTGQDLNEPNPQLTVQETNPVLLEALTKHSVERVKVSCRRMKLEQGGLAK